MELFSYPTRHGTRTYDTWLVRWGWCYPFSVPLEPRYRTPPPPTQCMWHGSPGPHLAGGLLFTRYDCGARDSVVVNFAPQQV